MKSSSLSNPPTAEERRYRFEAVAWTGIILFSTLIGCVFAHWRIALHPLWIVGPIVAVATLVTARMNRGDAMHARARHPARDHVLVYQLRGPVVR